MYINADKKRESAEKDKSSTPVHNSSIRTASPNATGIPDGMKSQFESMSGFSFDDVCVHYNSDKPAQLQALAYTQGNQVYVGPGQEKHLGHELGHVVQQKQGRVAATGQHENIPINDSDLLENDANHIAQMSGAAAKYHYP